MTTTGAKSGKERVIPIVYTRDGDRLVIAASKGGAPDQPGLVPQRRGPSRRHDRAPGREFAARATVPDRPERDRLFAAHAAAMPGFAEYEAKTDRVIPIIVLGRV